jgi:hypothetical protein
MFLMLLSHIKPAIIHIPRRFPICMAEKAGRYPECVAVAGKPKRGLAIAGKSLAKKGAIISHPSL